MKGLFNIAAVGLCVLLLSTVSKAQVLKPVKWEFSAKKISTNLYELQMKATVDAGWKIYSQQTPEGGPLPTKIMFNKNSDILLGGKVKELGTLKKKHEEAFGVDIHYYTDKAAFVQVLKTKQNKPAIISGKIVFMACDESQCLPPEEVEFKVELKL